jgi:Tfp pilus assembly protein PilF
MVVIAVCVVVLLTGCTETARRDAAQQRWQKTIDQARLEAARQSIEEGKLTYAQKILEDVSCDSIAADNARQMLAQLQDNAIVQVAQVPVETFENQAF